MMLEEFIEEVKARGFKTIYFLCSGGYDSTYMLLKLYNQFPDCEKYILYNNTMIGLKECRNLVYTLSFITNIPVIETKPLINVKKILDESFLALKNAQKLVELHEYSKKTVFKCCYYLKEKPAMQFYKKIENKSLNIAFLGIKKDDSQQRDFWLSKLRKKNKYIHYNKMKRIYIGYPLRDIDNDEVKPFIESLDENIIHSGCKICPVLLLFNLFKENPKRYINSKKYYLKISDNIPCIDLLNVEMIS